MVGALLPPVAAQIIAIYALTCIAVCAAVRVCVCLVMATKDAFSLKGHV